MRFYRLEGRDGQPYIYGLGGLYRGHATIVEIREDSPETREDLTDGDGFPLPGWIWSF